MQICICYVGKHIIYLSQSIRFTFMVWREKKKKKTGERDLYKECPLREVSQNVRDLDGQVS